MKAVPTTASPQRVFDTHVHIWNGEHHAGGRTIRLLTPKAPIDSGQVGYRDHETIQIEVASRSWSPDSERCFLP